MSYPVWLAIAGSILAGVSVFVLLMSNIAGARETRRGLDAARNERGEIRDEAREGRAAIRTDVGNLSTEMGNRFDALSGLIKGARAETGASGTATPPAQPLQAQPEPVTEPADSPATRTGSPATGRTLAPLAKAVY